MPVVRFPRYSTLASSLLILLGAVGASAAEPCAWLPIAEVERALPDYGPWEGEVGGAVGACQFVGNTQELTNSLGLNQQFKATPAEAAHFVKSLKAEMAKSYRIEAAPGLGAEAFFYSPKEKGEDGLWWVAHQGKVVVMGMLVVHHPATTEDKAAAGSLVKQALVAGNRPQMAEKAASCPYFEPGLMKKLLPGKGYTSQQFGENSCMANDANGAAVVLTRIESKPQPFADARRNDTCSHTAVDALGPYADMAYACKSGNPSADLLFVVAPHVYTVSLTTSKEPSAAQRADLVRLGQFIASLGR